MNAPVAQRLSARLAALEAGRLDVCGLEKDGRVCVGGRCPCIAQMKTVPDAVTTAWVLGEPCPEEAAYPHALRLHRAFLRSWAAAFALPQTHNGRSNGA